ncbi:MAG TPA: helix-turn-helix transcriptional regulator, partial [Verrucomicrobiae bacterium]|nr:helix-turn-helix transcriptional regulator [Verrucomicrobiae bacterium]
MLNANATEFSSDVFLKVEPHYKIAQESDPASSHDELAEALGIVRATVGQAIDLTRDHLRLDRWKTVGPVIEDHRADLAEGTELALLSLDVALGVPDSVEAMLDPFHGYPEVVRWLNQRLQATGLTQLELAGLTGLSASTVSRVLSNKPDLISRDTVVEMARALAIAQGKKGDPFAEDLRTARGHYAVYKKVKDEESERSDLEGQSEQPESPPPAESARELDPLVGTIGATAMEGIGVTASSTGRMTPVPAKRAMAMIERRRDALITYLRLAQLALDVVTEAPRAIEIFIDPRRDFPELIRVFNSEAESLNL